MAQYSVKQRPQPIRGLWRAGCVDEAHVRFGRRAAETGRLRDRHRAAVRPHHLNVRLDEEKLCLLVMIGVRVDGTKELVALADGYRESTGSWADLLRDAKRRGMRAAVLAVGDGAFGSGVRCARCSRRPASSAAGSTGPVKN